METYPTSGYDDLGEVLTALGISEAIVTVMSERGAPTPVAWTRLRAPESRMGPADPAAMQALVETSPRHAKYAAAVDRESTREQLAARLEEVPARPRRSARPGRHLPPSPSRQTELARKPSPARRRQERGDMVHDVITSDAVQDVVRTAAREIARGMFGSGRR